MTEVVAGHHACHPWVDMLARNCNDVGMSSQPRGDSHLVELAEQREAEWWRVLAHRRGDESGARAAIERFESAGVTPADVRAHLIDGGDLLYRVASEGGVGWADAFGGHRVTALIAAEVSALMSHLVARAATVRSASIGALLDDYSAVTVANALGVARQKVYELARPKTDQPYSTTTPWSNE